MNPTKENESAIRLLKDEYDHMSILLYQSNTVLIEHCGKTSEFDIEFEKLNIFSKMIFCIKRFFRRCKAITFPSI